MKRLYQSWPGRNRFFCGGQLLAGPDRLYFYLALSFIVVPFIISCGFIWPYLFIRLGWYVIIGPLLGYIALAIASVTFMMLTRYRDPGIIPRGLAFTHDPENPWDYERKKPPETIKINVYGENIRIKYCETCNIYRPPRAIHCSVCNNCVDRFDHHYILSTTLLLPLSILPVFYFLMWLLYSSFIPTVRPWIGNCVGRRNYQTFFAFVWATILSCVFVLCISIVHLVFIIIDVVDNQTGVRIFTYLLKYGGWCSGLMIPYCLLALALVGFLGTFHCTLISAGQTTNEKLKGLYRKKRNPHSKGLIGNWLAILFAPRAPSNFDFRSFVDEAEQKKCRRKGWPQRRRKDTEERKSKRKTAKKGSAKDSTSTNNIKSVTSTSTSTTTASIVNNGLDFELEEMESGRAKNSLEDNSVVERRSGPAGKKKKGNNKGKELRSIDDNDNDEENTHHQPI